MPSKKLKIGGLCSGVGGIELGFKKAGYDIAWANDMDKYAMLTYEKIMGKNHYIGKQAMPMESILEEKTLREQLTKVDVLGAGFPCQAFSIAGYRKGFDDERGNVFFRILNIINYLGDNSELPKVLLLENVKNFKTHDNNQTYERVKTELYNLGYSVYTKILNTSNYTIIPQNRERTFIVCFLGEEKWEEYQFDEYQPTFEGNAGTDCPATYKFHKEFLSLKKNKQKDFKHFLDGHKDVPEKYYYTEEKYPRAYTQLKSAVDKYNTIYQYRRVYVRENQSNQCPTLTANMGTGGHNVPIVLVDKKKGVLRKLTPRECFKFQGYGNISLPSNVADGQLYKQAGNSVTVPLITRLAKAIKKSLD